MKKKERQNDIVYLHFYCSSCVLLDSCAAINFDPKTYKKSFHKVISVLCALCNPFRYDLPGNSRSNPVAGCRSNSACCRNCPFLFGRWAFSCSLCLLCRSVHRRILSCRVEPPKSEFYALPVTFRVANWNDFSGSTFKSCVQQRPELFINCSSFNRTQI